MTPAVRYLEQHDISFKLLRYRINDTSDIGLAAACALKLDHEEVFKTLIAQLSNRQLVCAMVPVSATLNLKLLARAADVRAATMAPRATAERATGYVAGGISPLGQKKRLLTFIDSQAACFEQIYVSGGKRGLEIGIAPDDLIGACGAQTCPLRQRDST